MVIDQQKCGGCILACKAENHTPGDINWCDKITKTAGTFPDVRFEYISTMCNHGDDALCVTACPTRAMYKSPQGLTLHDPDKCIGCKACMVNCPYGVISCNWRAACRHGAFRLGASHARTVTSPRTLMIRVNVRVRFLIYTFVAGHYEVVGLMAVHGTWNPHSYLHFVHSDRVSAPAQSRYSVIEGQT